MRKNFKKKIFSILAAILILTSSLPALANGVNMPATIYEKVEKNNLASGLVHEKIMRFTTSGWWNINVLRVNLKDPYTEIKGLYSQESVSKRARVTSMVDSQDAVAGINADFFHMSGISLPLGTMVEDGEIVSIPRDMSVKNLPGFFIDILNQGNLIDYFEANIYLKNLTRGQTLNVNVMNSFDSKYHAVVVLDKHFGQKSIGNGLDASVVELVVVDDIVTDVRIGKEAVDIPENGYVVVANGGQANSLLSFYPGDRLDLSVVSNPDINNIKFSVGGGNIILRDGSILDLSPTSPGEPNGAHPRTGIGISSDKKEIILVTIDGRDTSFKGVSQPVFAGILKELGAYNAINLDGGGSTAMAIKPLGQAKSSLANKPSDGSERAVVNGVGVFSNAPVSDLAYIKLTTNDNKMFVNSTREFQVRGYDVYHNPVPIDREKVLFSMSDSKGLMVDDRFKALSQGEVAITASYNGIVTSTDIKILGPVKDISTSLSSFNISTNSEKALPSVYGLDEEGNKAIIDSYDIEFTPINEVGRVENGTFYSGANTVAGALSLKFGEGLKNILIYVGEEAKLLEGFEDFNRLGFTSYPTGVPIGFGPNEDAKEGKLSLDLAYDFTLGQGTRAAYIKFNNNDLGGLQITNRPSKLGLWVKGDGNNGWLRATVKDSKGNSQKLDFAKNVNWQDWKYLTVSLPSDLVYPIVLEDIYLAEANEANSYSGSLAFDGLTALYSPSLGNLVLPTPSEFKDSKNTLAGVENTGFSLGIMVNPKNLNDLVKYDAQKTVDERTSKHKSMVYLDEISKDFAGGYNKLSQDGFTYIYLNTEKAGIRASDSSQWNHLKYDLENIASENIVLLTKSPIFNPGGFTDPLEADLLHQFLVETKARGKNVYLVHGGSENRSELKDGIRYIGFDSRPLTQAEDIYNISLVEFVVNGSNISYNASSIFPRPEIKVSK